MLADIPDADGAARRFGPFDPDDDELRTADQDTQFAQMREWFLARYCDPAHETPYESAEGGYIWIWGGPYYAEQELQDRFSGIVPDDVIERLATDLSRDG